VTATILEKTTLLKYWALRASPDTQAGFVCVGEIILAGKAGAENKKRAGKPALSDRTTKLTESD